MTQFAKAKKSNPFLPLVEKTKEYKAFIALVEDALTQQWKKAMMPAINAVYAKDPKIGKSSWFGKQEEDKEHEPDLKKLLAEAAAAIGAIYSLESITGFKTGMFDSLKFIANKGGQTIIDQIDPSQPIQFRLSKKEYIDLIKERVNTLITDLDKTSKKRLLSEISKGIVQRKTKTEMVKQVSKAIKTISKERAGVIVATETNAILEYMRHETARLNGYTKKVWRSVIDDRTSEICQELDGTTISITSQFSGTVKDFKGISPPAHINCRSYLDYIEIKSYEDFIRSANISALEESTELLFEKYTFYTKPKGFEPLPVINRDAVWAGGESLVGKDRAVGVYYRDIKSVRGWEADVKEAFAIKNNQLALEQEGAEDKGPVWASLKEARQKLSDNGFVQLMLALGISKKIPRKQ